MHKRNDTFDLTRWIGDGLPKTKPANDLKSLDERFRASLDSCAFWRALSRNKTRVKAMTFCQRVRLAEMLAIVTQVERDLGLRF
jgi:hypothetical protein